MLQKDKQRIRGRKGNGENQKVKEQEPARQHTGQARDKTLEVRCSRVTPLEETETWTQSETVDEDTIVLMGGHFELETED